MDLRNPWRRCRPGDLWYEERQRRGMPYSVTFRDGELPIQYKRSYDNPNPSLLYFGIPINYKVILDYLIDAQHDGRRIRSIPPVRSTTKVIEAGLRLLSKRCGCVLLRRDIFWTPDDSDFLIGFFSNYIEHEKEVIAFRRDGALDALVSTIKAELKLDSDVQPQWCFDFTPNQSFIRKALPPRGDSPPEDLREQ
ncbi:hypothetical protein EIP91_000863 [Steccherinum ochraceum]|uniref:Uncharacterized protein n=1 Tax=Steccherinum ochraceum TaxID=92696 RepID=A0A4R0RSU4_9APHY|nr:hypothetical protein EIP91_000863 [Steccherinum ochraceum]